MALAPLTTTTWPILDLTRSAVAVGRAVSLSSFAFLAGSPIGGWFAGELIAAGGARLGFGVAGAAAIVTVGMAMARLRVLERRCGAL